jgi:hypothetical protein
MTNSFDPSLRAVGPRNSGERGIALIMTMMLLALLMAMLLGYFTLTRTGLATAEANMDSVDGLYAAEAGLNIRADRVRQIFEGYSRPTGSGPTGTSTCSAGNMGSGDMGCVDFALLGTTATTYVVEQPDNPEMIVIPRGELYQNLNAQEYAYTVDSVALDSAQRTQAILSMAFKSRLVPLFQFAAFYDKDLEILPGPAMTLAGPVHVNGNLFLGANASLDIEGQVTTSGDLYRGRKNTDSCMSGAVNVADPENQTEIPTCSGGTELMNQTDLDAWNGMIETGVDVVTVPPAETLDPTVGEPYWDKADVRIMLNLNGSTPTVEVFDPNGNINAGNTAALASCSGAASYSDSFYNNREALDIEMLELDVEKLMDCLHNTTIMGVSKGIDETSEGGLVWYVGVNGPDSDVVNNYGVRLRNGDALASGVAGAPAIAGLTVVTNQAIYIEGNYNATDKKPAAILADSLNVLSNNWSDGNDELALSQRIASSTTVYAAFLAGTDSTGDCDGCTGFPGQYNGGLENYPRFHEKWGGKTLTYRGSFVSLDRPRHVDGLWENQSYQPPIRDWGYDTDFDDAANLPPLSPRFVYLRQMLFQREFEL